MKKFILILGFCLAFSTNARAQDINQNQPEQKRSDISYRKCENLLMPTKVADKPLLSLFADIKIAELTNNCFMQKIKEAYKNGDLEEEWKKILKLCGVG